MVCKDFRISEGLLAKWCSGEIDPPLTVLLAIYWQSHKGLQHAFSESHWTNQYNCFRARDAEVKQAEMANGIKALLTQLKATHPEAIASLEGSPFLRLVF